MKPKPSKCLGCPFYGDGMGFVPDELNSKAKVSFLAQNPGDTEEFNGRPLIGKSGQFVQNEISKYSMSRGDASYLNVIKCRWYDPIKKKKVNILPENGQTAEAARHCVSAYLISNLKEINPNVCALLGELALVYGVERNEIGSWRGSVFIADDGPLKGTKVIGMIHPAALWRDLTWRTSIKNDFTRLFRESKSPEVSFTYRDNFRIGVDADEFIATLEGLHGKRVVLDVETSFKKPIEARLKIIGIGWSSTDAMNYLWRGDEQDLKVIEAISNFKGEWITATPYDYIIIKNYGGEFEWDNCHDLTLLHSRFDIELPHTVEFICSMFTNRPYWKWMGGINQGLYNCLDCAAEWEAFDRLYGYCLERERGVINIYEKDRLLLPVEVDLHLNGFPCSKVLMDEERDWYIKRREIVERELLEAFTPKKPPVDPGVCENHKRYTGKTPLKLRKGEEEVCAHCKKIFLFVKETSPLNLRSRKRLMEILKKEGMQMIKDKESKKESLAKGKVADLYKKYGDNRLLRLLDFWEVDKAISSYFQEAWITKHTGRIHSTFSMHSAMHRWHNTKPNMQQQKKPEKEVIEYDCNGD